MTDKDVAIINEFTDGKSDGYCLKCGEKPLKTARSKLNSEINKLNRRLTEQAQSIPILSTHTPYKWEYESLSIVTGQSTTGTGVFSEFTSGFTDFFGVQSGAYNKKLAEGENRCFDQIRMKTLALGGNAVIATDIDYAETGTAKGMLMVCMTGTAIKLKNVEILGEEKAEIIRDIDKTVSQLNYLKNI